MTAIAIQLYQGAPVVWALSTPLRVLLLGPEHEPVAVVLLRLLHQGEEAGQLERHDDDKGMKGSRLERRWTEISQIWDTLEPMTMPLWTTPTIGVAALALALPPEPAALRRGAERAESRLSFTWHFPGILFN